MTYKTTAAFALALTLVTCSAAPVVAEGYPELDVCKALATIAMEGAEMGAAVDYIDPAIDELHAIAETEEDARSFVSVFVSGYAQGVTGTPPEAVALKAYAVCASVAA